MALATSAAVLVSGAGALSALGILGASAQSTHTVDLKASYDTYVSSSNVTTAYGSASSLYATAMGRNARKTFVRFVVPAGSDVVKAQLLLTRDDHHFPTTTVSVAKAADGVSGATTFKSAPSSTGGTLDSAKVDRSGKTVTLDVSSAVKDAGTYTFVVTSPVTADVVRFRSLEMGGAVPTLHLTVADDQPAVTPKPTPTPPAPTPTPTVKPPVTLPAPTPTQTVKPPIGPGACADTNAKGVPACGVLWGVTSPVQNSDSVATTESQLGRKFDIVYHFKGLTDALPSADERSIVSSGHLLHINIEARSQTYAQIINGQFDASFRSQAAGLQALGVPVYLTFDHEADAKTRYDVRGTPAQFVAAWRHIVDVYRTAGASHVVWVWNVTGFPTNFSKYPGLWPGNSYVDWISWDPYNHAGCMTGPVVPSKWESFQSVMSPMYNWLQTQGPSYGIDNNKPYMLNEYATAFYPGDSTATANWYRAVPNVLASYPKLKAVQFFDTVGMCDYRLTNDSTVEAGFALAGKQALTLTD